MTFRLIPGKDILLSLLLLGAVGMALGAGTFAYFSDTDASAGNSIHGATFDLKLNGSDSHDSIVSIPNAVPGDTASADIELTNAGTANADHVAIEFDYTESASERTEPSDPDLDTELGRNGTAAYIEVTELTYDDGSTVTDLLTNVNDSNGNKIVDLHDLRTDTPVVDDLSPPGSNGANPTHLSVSLRVASDESNAALSDEDLMADGIDFEIRFTLNQQATQ